MAVRTQGGYVVDCVFAFSGKPYDMVNLKKGFPSLVFKRAGASQNSHIPSALRSAYSATFAFRVNCLVTVGRLPGFLSEVEARFNNSSSGSFAATRRCLF